MQELNLKPFQYIDELLPSAFTLLQTISDDIKSNSMINSKVSRYQNLINIWSIIRTRLLTLEEELRTFCDAEWSLMEQYQDGHICSHSLAAACTIFTLPYFQKLEYHDKNILVYGLLFHDIAKKGSPVIETKDPQHPFTSAASTLKIFNTLGWIHHPEDVDEAIAFINNAFFFKKWANFMDNTKLAEIYQILLYLTGLTTSKTDEFRDYMSISAQFSIEKLFVFEILAIILLHQSIDLDPHYPNFTPLTKTQILKYLSPRLLKILTILHLGDNGSYNLPLRFEDWTYTSRIWNTYKNLKSLFKSKKFS